MGMFCTAAKVGSALTLAILTGCLGSFRGSGWTVPGPAGALAAAALGKGRLAVLAGGDHAKGLFVLDAQTGAVLRSFGVTKEATGISTASDNGPLLLSVGAARKGRMVGSIEEWSLDGIKQRIVPLPTRGLGITQVVRGIAYVLLGGAGLVRAAVPFDTASLKVGKAIPLEAGAQGLDQCPSDSATRLVFTGTLGRLVLRDPSSGGEIHSVIDAQGAVCRPDGQVVYAVSGSALRRRIAVMSIPSLGEITSMAASTDALALFVTPERRLVALNATTRLSTLETLPNAGAGTTVAARDEPASQP
jgi:hypothetical protein